jgi:hypothetical protein
MADARERMRVGGERRMLMACAMVRMERDVAERRG